MRRPAVRIDDFEAVYDYYEQHRQSQLFARAMHLLFARVYRADLT